MTDEIKLNLPTVYDFAYVAGNLGVSWIAGLQLGMICLPGEIAINPAAVVTVEDHVPTEIEDDIGGEEDDPDFVEREVRVEMRTLISFMSGATLALDAEQMVALENWIRRAQAEIMAAQKQQGIGNRGPVLMDGRTKQVFDEIKRKSGLK